MAKITTDICDALELLRAGELVAFPTETVYGLGADARNEQVIKKVFAAKGRPADHPLIVHIGDIQQLSDWARYIPESALKLAQAFWPGPLTIMLPKQPWVSDLITSDQDSIALRMPNHPLALQLLREFNSGLVGPSANRYQYVSPTSARHVQNDLGENIAAILDGGECNVGLESTIISLLAEPKILRRGVISESEISKVLGVSIKTSLDEAQRMHAPGSDKLHYAPRTKLEIVSVENLWNKVQSCIKQQTRCSVISFLDKPKELSDNIFWQKITTNETEYARNLYALLRRHDVFGNELIICEQVPEHWVAIIDRLKRASARI